MPGQYRLRRCLPLCLSMALLCGCGVWPFESATGSAPASPVPEATAPSAASAAATPQASAAASFAPSPAAPASTAASSIAAASPSAASPSGSPALEQAYTPLILLEAAAIAIEEAARQLTEGSEAEGFARMIAVSVLTGVANAALAEEPPFPEAAPVWGDARAVGQELNGVVTRWANQELTPAQVAAELEPLTPRIEAILQVAETEIAAAYNVDPAELQRLRDETIAQMEQALASALPRASTAP